MLKFLYAVALLGLGSYLEIYYYQFRFMGDGVGANLSIAIGLSLTILLTALFIVNKKFLTWVGIVVLLIFSIISTSNGQAASLAQMKIDENQKIVDNLTRPYAQELSRLQAEYDLYSKALSSTIDSLDDLYEWKNTSKTAQEQMNLISPKINAAESMIAKIKNDNAISVKKVSIYEFYGNMLSWSLEEWLQFVFQTVLSLFIAIMAPLGISMLSDIDFKKVFFGLKKKTTKKKDPKLNTRKPEFKLSYWEPLAKTWIRYNWFVLRRKTRTLVDYSVFIKMMNKINFMFSEYEYNELKRLSEACGIIKDNTIVEQDENRAFSELLKLMRKQ